MGPNDLPAWVLDARPSLSRAPISMESSSKAALSDRVPAPSREELLDILKRLGSVRATAKHFERDRRQIYRWIRSYGIRDDEL